MTKLKTPLLSLGAVGRLAKAIAFRKHGSQTVAEKLPIPKDAKSLAQLSWRHMYQKAVALWHALSTAEKEEWESSARPKHMTGFAWFMSQALKPNPGLYLPLQGGTMAGNIDMATWRILDLPDPLLAQEAITLAYFTANIAPYLYNEGARVYHNAHQAIPNSTSTILSYNSERYDTDAIHSPTVNNSRLTCKTAGKYVINTQIAWETIVGGRRNIVILLNGATSIANEWRNAMVGGICRHQIATIYHLAVNDYVETRVYHDQGAPLNVVCTSQYSPEFQMQRIGA